MKPDVIVSVTDARVRFEELVERAGRGEVILITRRRKPPAYLVSIEIGRRIYPELQYQDDRP